MSGTPRGRPHRPKRRYPHIVRTRQYEDCSEVRVSRGWCEALPTVASAGRSLVRRTTVDNLSAGTGCGSGIRDRQSSFVYFFCKDIKWLVVNVAVGFFLVRELGRYISILA